MKQRRIMMHGLMWWNEIMWKLVHVVEYDHSSRSVHAHLFFVLYNSHDITDLFPSTKHERWFKLRLFQFELFQSDASKLLIEKFSTYYLDSPIFLIMAIESTYCYVMSKRCLWGSLTTFRNVSPSKWFVNPLKQARYKHKSRSWSSIFPLYRYINFQQKCDKSPH